MKKKARFYLGFRICTNVQVKLLFLGFHLYIPSSLVHVCKCRKPHKHWVFRSLVHFLISSRGVPPLSNRATGGGLTPALIWTSAHVHTDGVSVANGNSAGVNESHTVKKRGLRVKKLLRWK